MPRFLFYVPAVERPTGGVSVILEWVDVLKSAGIEAELITDRRGYAYPFAASAAPVLFSEEVWRALRADRPVRDRLLNPLGRRPAGRDGPVLALRPDDVVIVPEYAAAWLPSAFPGQQRILLAQAFVWFIDRVLRQTWTPGDFSSVICTSDICAGVAGLRGMAPIHRVPLTIDTALFRPRPKRDVIAYMPRKRAAEAELAVEALRARGNLSGHEILPIDGVPVDEVARIMGEARIFLSFSEREGFGLPPAEAMAAGCLVIGYTGAGGDEYFDPAWSWPVSDGNLPALVETVETVAAACRRDPAAMQARAERAAAEIAARYDRASRDDTLLALFRRLSEGAQKRA